MAGDREDRVQKRAYEIWQREGRPSGRDQEHWYRAQSEENEAERRSAAAPAPASLEPAPVKAGRARRVSAAPAPEAKPARGRKPKL